MAPNRIVHILFIGSYFISNAIASQCLSAKEKSARLRKECPDETFELVSDSSASHSSFSVNSVVSAVDDCFYVSNTSLDFFEATQKCKDKSKRGAEFMNGWEMG